MQRQHRLKAKDRVIVRSPVEIVLTLDADGTLDGLPFMPEMLDWCGQSFRVERRVEKTCVDAPLDYSNRRFPMRDVVVLEGSRCDGNHHDGCKRACKVFWKEAWLQPVEAAASSKPISATDLDSLTAALKIKSDETHYFCQSTQLCKASEAFPGRKRPLMVRVAVREIRNGDRSVLEILKLFVLWSFQKMLRAVAGNQFLRGHNKRTPTEFLGLQPGERVRIKSRAEMVATLDRYRRNRGMYICYEMTRFCGGQAEVRDRVDRIIDERTGEMREMSNTVSLKNIRSRLAIYNADCICYNQLGDCPRGELFYWRELWLERAGDALEL